MTNHASGLLLVSLILTLMYYEGILTRVRKPTKRPEDAAETEQLTPKYW